MKKVIINADDFGLSRSTNEGIVIAMTEGIVSSTTLMVNMPEARHAVELANKYNIKNIGVHLNLTKGPTVLPRHEVPLLYLDDNKRFDVRKKKRFDFRKKPLTDEILMQIEQELEAQILKCYDFGIKPTHLDSHHHIHMLDGISDIVINLAKKYNLAVRTVNYSKYHDQVKMPVFVDCSFYDKRVSLKQLQKILTKEHDGIFEIMTHPGYMSQELVDISIYNEKREQELAILTSDEILTFIQENNIELVSFKDLVSR